MPLQGNDNRSTVSWLPAAAVAPSSSWNSTYGVHYRHPSKRLTRNRDYWLRRAAERAAREQAAADAGLLVEGKGSRTFRDPSLARAYDTANASAALRHPSSLSRSSPLCSPDGLLTARPLHPSLVATAARSSDSFATHASQRFYEPTPTVSALRALEGLAAAETGQFPLQATARPALSPMTQYTYSTRVRPATAQARLRSQPRFDVVDADLAASGVLAPALPDATGAEWEQAMGGLSLGGSPSASASRSSTMRRSMGASSTTGEGARARSLHFRPLLTSSRSSPALPANTLLSLTQAQQREATRAAEWQGAQHAVLQV